MTLLLRLALLAPLLLVLPPTQDAQAQARCEATRSLQLKVATDFPEPELITSYASKDIPERTARVKRRIQELSSRLNGLTVFQMESGYQMQVQQTRAGVNCYGLNALDISIDVKRLVVYIASELKPGSCEYDVTYAHEMKHVAIYREGVNRLQQRWADATEASSLRRPIRADDAQQALSRFAKAIETIFADIRQQETARMTRENALLDTPSNYRAEQRICG